MSAAVMEWALAAMALSVTVAAVWACGLAYHEGKKPMSHRNGTCAKCGSGDVATTYTVSLKELWESHPWRCHKALHTRKDEHLDYRCKSCGFEWEGDCLDKPVGGGGVT